jgi:hypothetical protein
VATSNSRSRSHSQKMAAEQVQCFIKNERKKELKN